MSQMTSQDTPTSRVVAVGALGGSGTRAIAQVLMDAGIYMGDDLNSANDNLLFTRLFKDPRFRERADAGEVAARFRVLEAWMAQDRLQLSQAVLLLRSTRSNPTIDGDVRFLTRVLSKLVSRPVQRTLWGWKEPNTQLWVEEIGAHFPDLRYLHVLRHGLDMAFSANRHQLLNWGPRFGIQVEEGERPESLTWKQLEYWIRSTRAALEAAERLPGGYLLINHGRFCREPRKEIDRMLDYIGVDPEPGKREALYAIPRSPSSEGRFREHDLGVFDRAQLDFLRDMGFEL
ncbi:MAG: hypothetical protein DSZ00_07615 [Gammaproteobacteria bacterium]|nr:MAG: hypothetical protein DSZ00_07615 [Gammaproteobacteria bacterium]